jgi:oligopeptide/dipeptide ABC transporter ATP-binding protein
MRLTPEAGIIEQGEIRFTGINLTENIAKEFKLIQKKNNRVKLKRNKSMLNLLNHKINQIRGREITMIFQEPMTSLNPVYTIGRQVSEILLRHKMDLLVKRIIARSSATDEKLREVTNAAVHGISQTELRNLLRKIGLEELEDQIWFTLSRKDIGVTQKIQTISNLSKQRVSPITLTFLGRLKKSSKQLPVEYRLLNRVPIARRWLGGMVEKEALQVSYELLSLVNMPNVENVLRQYPHELSGGMRQRVMIAMAIATRPKLLIADEPTSALDVTVQAQILELLRELKRTFNSAILFISHDIGVISEICDRVGVMYAGNLVEVAKLNQLFADPKHPYTQGLFASIPKYGEKRELLQTIEGTVPNLIDPPAGCRFRTRCPRVHEKCSTVPPWTRIDEDHGVLCWLYADGEKRSDQ